MPLLPVSCYALPDRTSDAWADYMGSRQLNKPLAEQDVIWLTSRYCLKCLWLTLSLSRVINVKPPLQPHQKLYIMDNLIFIAYSDGSWLYYQYSTSLIHFPLEGWENIHFIFWSERIKEICKMLRGGGFNLRDFWGIFPFDGLHLLHQDCRRRLWILWRRSFLDQTLQFKWAWDVILWRILLLIFEHSSGLPRRRSLLSWAVCRVARGRPETSSPGLSRNRSAICVSC